MKLTHRFLLVIATASVALTGCDKKTADTGGGSPAPKSAVPDEKTAISTFKADVESVGKWIEEKQKAAPADPAAGMAMMGEIMLKVKSIRTDGLPADLKGAWGEMGGVMDEMGTIFKGLPTGKSEKPEEAMKAFGELMPKIMEIQKKMEPVAKKLQDIGTKYGLDMSKVAPK